MQWNASHTIPASLSDALCSISLVHQLSLAMPLDWDVLTPDLWSILQSELQNYTLCHYPPQNSVQLHRLHECTQISPCCQVFRHGVCLQSGWLRIIWKWERGLWDRFEIDQNWSDRDWSRLISPRLLDRREAEYRQWICENWEENWKRVEIVSSSFAKLRYKLWSMSSQARMCCMRFCLLVQFVHLRPWELRIHGLGWKRARVGAFAREKAHLSSR